LKRYIEKITIFIKRYLTYLGVGNLFENYGELSDPWTLITLSIIYSYSHSLIRILDSSDIL